MVIGYAANITFSLSIGLRVVRLLNMALPRLPKLAFSRTVENCYNGAIQNSAGDREMLWAA